MTAQSARLDFQLEFDGERTRPQRALATPPLQISRARYDDPAAPGRLNLTLVHLGGVLAGDQYELNVAIGSGAEAVVAGAAATQIYTMSSGSACQQTVIRAAPDSTLCWMPGPQILFAGARYCQSTRVELARGAFVMLSEVLVAGRLARGECWRFDRCENTVEIVDQRGELLAAEHTLIEPSRRSPALPGVMGSFAVLGSLWLLGDRFNAEHTAQVISAKGGSISAAVLPGRCGVGVRVLGAGLTAVRQALQRCYNSLAAEGLAPAGPGIPW